MKFPKMRPRRIRYYKEIRDALSETKLSIDDLITPVFVDETIDEPTEIASMPGYYRWPLNKLDTHISELLENGLNKILLFGIPKEKDEVGSQAYDSKGIVQRAIEGIRESIGEKVIIFTDVCLCQYTTHGHCGIVIAHKRRGREEWLVDNDKSLEYLSKTALSHAEAGADYVAPSNMMDGVVGRIREVLDDNGYVDVGIMSYSVKYASNFYGPFREAAESAPRFGDRRSYQMDPRNSYEAVKEAHLDIEEGADILMVKPALPYLDIISLIKREFPYMPLAAYNVSGEYLMVESASREGWVDRDKIILEILYSIKRAGADLIITYHSTQAAKLIGKGYIPF